MGTDGIILLVNRTRAAWMRTEPSNLEYTTIHDIIPKGQAEDVEALDRKVIENAR